MADAVSERIFSKRRDTPCEAVVVHCSDHRFQQGFRELLALELGLVSYALLAIPGGGHFASMEQLQPKFAKIGMQNLKFLINRTGVKRIIIVAHDDCLFFQDQLQFFFSETSLNKKQITCLKRAGLLVNERFPNAKIELYLVDADVRGSLSLEKIK